MNKFRTHNCSEINETDVGKNVRLSGWIHRKRDHGNLLFLDLRDHFGPKILINLLGHCGQLSISLKAVKLFLAT